MIGTKKLLIADEPTGSLDSKSSKQVLEQFSRLKRNDSAILMVTHDPKVASYADRVLFFYDGRIVDDLDHPDINHLSSRLVELESR